MPKKEKDTKKQDKITELIKKGVYELFDRRPRGSLVNGEVAKLSKEIADAV
jgi:hypothetical protein